MWLCGRDFGDGNGAVFILERVSDTFAAGDAHDDFDALIMLEGWADVPHVHCMKTPQRLTIGLVVSQYLGA